MPPSRRRGASPDRTTLAELAQAPPRGRLRKAPATDPVLGPVGTSAENSSDNPAGNSADTDQSTARAGQRGRARAEPTGTSTPAKTKVGFYQDTADTARARAAYDWTRPREGHRSFSDFIAAAVMREVHRLEAEYHAGNPWPPVQPGQLPTGKPLGA
jgi:hypothetical protein